MNHKAVERRIKRHILAAENKIFMAIQPGLEEAGEWELEGMKLSWEREKEAGSLSASGRLEDLWKLVLLGRSFSRIYLRLKAFKAEGFRELKRKLSSIPWELYLRESCDYRVRITSSRSRLHVHDKIIKALNHSLSERFISLEGQPPRYREKGEKDPQIQTIIIRAMDDHFTISLDAGGGALYERGYRQHVNEAPLKENIAAALLCLCQARNKNLIIDPMCGSGTFTLEALSLTAGCLTAPERHYPFEYWPSFRPGRFDWLKKQLNEARTSPCRILASDLDEKSLRAAEMNLNSFREQNNLSGIDCRFEQKDFFHSRAEIGGHEEGLVILNPPYGKRLALQDQLDFFRKIGKSLKNDYPGLEWAVIAPGLECEKALGLRWNRKYLFRNGGFPVSFLIGGPQD